MYQMAPLKIEDGIDVPVSEGKNLLFIRCSSSNQKPRDSVTSENKPLMTRPNFENRRVRRTQKGKKIMKRPDLEKLVLQNYICQPIYPPAIALAAMHVCTGPPPFKLLTWFEVLKRKDIFWTVCSSNEPHVRPGRTGLADAMDVWTRESDRGRFPLQYKW